MEKFLRAGETVREAIGFRVMISNPDIEGYALPDFIREKVPMVKLGSWQKREREEPRCDDPYLSGHSKMMGCWRRNMTDIPTWNTWIRACTDFGVKGTRGLWIKILTQITAPRKTLCEHV